MIQEYQRIARLCIKRRFETETEQDRTDLDIWVALSSDNKKLLDDFMDDDKVMKELMLYDEADWKPSWERLVQRCPELQRPETTP